ncbi:MAG TPA: ABC transporter substrate-binding protein [Rubrobacter sp.]|jgi:multiple sugar transport system substrate-binding protein|nr:ABC transporter substrate-binding protein [Rubrobacter sp.]
MKHGRPRGLSRRDFLKVGGAGLAGAAFLGAAGCGGGEQGGGATEIYFTSAPDASGTTEKLIDMFNDKNKGKYKVIFRQGNSDTGQRFDKLRTQMQAGGEDLDVILGDVIWTAQLAESGWISDLSDRFTESQRKEFLPGSVEAITYKGKAFGMPWFTDTGLLYYRKDLLQESGFNGPPKTWDELKQMTRKVRENAGLKYGFVFQGAPYEGGVCDGMEFIWTHGGEVLDPNDPTKVLVDSPEAIAGLATERSMITERISPEAVTVYKEDESAGAFLNGDAVFLRNWPYVYALVGTSDYPELKPEQVGVSELPSADGEPGNGTVGDQPLYISSTAKDPDATWKFIQFLTAPEQQKIRAVEGAYLPTRTALYSDPEIQEKVPVVPLAQEALQHTRPRPVSPYYSDMSLEMAEQFNASLSGDISPEEAARTLKEQLERFIKEGQQT